MNWNPSTRRRKRLSFTLLAVYAFSLLYLLPSLCAKPLDARTTKVEVSTCHALQKALVDPIAEQEIILTSSLSCSPEDWSSSQIRISGSRTLRGSDPVHLHELDLSHLNASRGGIIVEPGAQLTLDRLAVRDRSLMQTNNFELSFVDVEPNGKLSMRRSYLLHYTCSGKDASSTPKYQAAPSIHVCGTRFLCGDQAADGDYRVDDMMELKCASSAMEDRDKNAESDSVHDGPVQSHVVLVALLFLVLGFCILAAIVVWMCRSRNQGRVLDTKLCQAENSFTESDISRMDLSLPTRRVTIDDFSIDLDHQVGTGGFGTVFAGKFKNQRCAVKAVMMGDVPQGNDLMTEANLCIGLSHPNVVKSYAIRSVKVKDLFGEQHLQAEDDCALLFMEYCDKGELSRAIDRGEYVLSFESLQPKMCAILHCALDIAKGLQYLHALGIVHGDIKPDNILRNSDELDPRGYICKICDFGLSKKVEATKTTTDTLGMISYMPPEMLRKGQIGRFTDVYSFGMLLWEMVTSDVPYSEVDYNQILMEAVHGRRPAIPESTPTTIAKLIRGCWNSDYTRRPSVSEIIRCLHMALSEWYASFPSQSIAALTIRKPQNSNRRSPSHLHTRSIAYSESIQSETVADDFRVERAPSSLTKSFSTCIQSESHYTGFVSTLTSTRTGDLESNRRSLGGGADFQRSLQMNAGRPQLDVLTSIHIEGGSSSDAS